MGRSDEKRERKRDRSRSASKEDRKRSDKESKRRRSRSRSESPKRRHSDRDGGRDRSSRDVKESSRSDTRDTRDRESRKDHDSKSDKDTRKERDSGRSERESRNDRDRSDRDRGDRSNRSDRDRSDRDRDRDRRERSGDRDQRERSSERKSSSKSQSSNSSSSQKIEPVVVAPIKTAEELEQEKEAAKAAEQALLDEEMKKRRDRVKAWQEAKAKRLAEEEAARLAEAGIVLPAPTASDNVVDMTVEGENDETGERVEGEEKPHGWSLEDDSDEENEGGAPGAESLRLTRSGSLTETTSDLPPLAPLQATIPLQEAEVEEDQQAVFGRIAHSGVAVVGKTSTKPLVILPIAGKSLSIAPQKPINSRIKAAAAVNVAAVKKEEKVPDFSFDEFDDPLDAFMSSLYSTGDVETQNLSAFGTAATKKEEVADVPAVHNVITMDQLLKEFSGGAKQLPLVSEEDDEDFMGVSLNSIPVSRRVPSSGERRGWESDIGESGANSPLHLHGGPRVADISDTAGTDMEVDETEEEREAREEQDRRDFVEAIRRAREEEDEIREKLNRIEESAVAVAAHKTTNKLGRVFAGEGDMVDEEEISGKKKSALELLEEAKRGKMLKEVDHSKVDYLPFRKNLYIVPRALSKLSEAEVNEKREDMHIKVRGRGCPAPVNNWEQCGLSDRLLQTIQAYNLAEPFAIQRQAIPAIMCGRDVIGVAKTGSGKTLAFLLPMLRHILDQPPLADNEGPIGLIMAPSRELAGQIFAEAKKFAKPLGLRAACIYGGAQVADQIADLKRGSHIVVCTPGRMIDILCMQAGKMVSLRRVTMVVLDEADRMFDMGFEPQIKMIVQNVRPDRQTVMFSATFPKQIEKLAKSVLRLPLEIVVGERSTVNKDITQVMEVHEEDDKFMRLLQLLGIWYEKGSVLVFVDKQEKCDQLFQELLKLGYPCLSLHGGKDQVDREHTLHEFKTGIKTVMIATSVAGRGLDVPDIVCVINYNCPNHMEDYVHRVGRTGRAGRKGTAYTFISQKEEQYAPVMVKILEKTKQPVPVELTELADAFTAKVDRGEAQWSSNGFKGSGYTFDADEMNAEQKAASLQKRAYDMEQGLLELGGDEADMEDNDEDEEGASTSSSGVSAVEKMQAFAASAAAGGVTAPTAVLPVITEGMTPLEKARAMAAAMGMNRAPGAAPVLPLPGAPTAPVDAKTALARAQQIAAGLTAGKVAVGSGVVMKDGQEYFADELDINDYPHQARRKVTQRTSLDEIIDRTGVAIISRGVFVAPGAKPPPGERRLHLLIEGTNDMSVRQAKLEMTRILEEETIRIGASAVTSGASGRYSVI